MESPTTFQINKELDRLHKVTYELGEDIHHISKALLPAVSKSEEEEKPNKKADGWLERVLFELHLATSRLSDLKLGHTNRLTAALGLKDVAKEERE